MSEAPPVSPLVVFLQKNPWAFPVGILLIMIVIGGAIYMTTRPPEGTWRYAVCRGLLEFEFLYPPTIDVLSVTEGKTTARLYVAEMNSFGNERIWQVDCDYQVNNGKVTLARMSLDRNKINDQRIAYYNSLIPTLLTQNMDTTLPRPLPRALDQLKR